MAAPALPLGGIGVGTQTAGGAPLPVYSRSCGLGSPIQCHEARVQLDTGNPTFRFGANRQHYLFFGNSLNSDTMMTNDFNNGRLSLVSHKLSSGTWLTCAAGAQDATIIARGNEIKQWQDAHRGQGKWGATFMWSFHHEPNNDEIPTFGANKTELGTNWRAAFAHILDIFYNTCGVTRWDGDPDFTTRTEGLITAINLASGISSGFTADWDIFWGNNAMMDQMCVMAAGDPYNFGSNCRTFENINSDLRAWGVTKRAQQEAAGRTFMTGIWETGTVEAQFQPGTDASWTATGLAKTKPNWYLNAAQYLKSGASQLSLWTYYDDAPGHPNQPDSTQASWDSWLANLWTNDLLIATDPLPTGVPPPPPVNSPTLVSSSAVINSTTDGTVFNSSAFDVGDDELLMFWLEADRTDGVNPLFPTFSWVSNTGGVVPAVPARVFGTENQWSTTAALRGQQSLWLTRSQNGAATGLVLRATFGQAHQGCTVILERVRGAEIGGVFSSVPQVAVALSVSAQALNATMPPAINNRNRTFTFASHALNEGSVPSRLGPVRRNPNTGAFGLTDGTITITRPSTAVLGDVLIASLNTTPNPTLTAPAGWTLLARQLDCHVFGIYVDADVLATPSFTWSGGPTSVTSGIITAYGNVATIGAVATLADADFGSTTTLPSVTTIQPNSLCIAAIASYNGVYGLSATNNWTQVAVLSSAPQTISTFERITPAAGAIGTATVTMATSGVQQQVVVLVLEAESNLVEGSDVSRTTPNVGTETSHTTTGVATAPGATWASPVAAGVVAVEVAAPGSALGVKLGSTVNNLSTFESMMGRSVDSERIFVLDTAATVPWGSGGWAQAVAAEASDDEVFISAFLGASTWAQVAAGNVDAYLTGIANNLATLRPGVFCYFPEPEDDTATRGTAAQFRSATSHVINLMQPLMPNWRFAVCLQDTSWFNAPAFIGTPFFSANGRVPSDWIVTEAQILAVNAFNRRGATYPAPSHPYADPAASTYLDMPIPLFADQWLSTADTFGKTVVLSEFGCAVDDPVVNSNGHTTRALWIGQAMDYMRGKVETVHYADLDSLNNRINMRITGGVKAAESDSVSAFVNGASAVPVTKSHTSTAIVRKTVLKTQTATAIIRKSLTRTQTADAIIKPTNAKTHTSDALLSKSGILKTHRSDAFITPYVLVQHITSNTASNVTSVLVN